MKAPVSGFWMPMPWSSRISPAIGGDQDVITPPACGWSAAFGRVEAHLEAGQRCAARASGCGSRGAVQREQRHRLDQRVDVEALGGSSGLVKRSA